MNGLRLFKNPDIVVTVPNWKIGAMESKTWFLFLALTTLGFF